MRVLIVEDDVIPANYLKKILELEKYEVIDMIATGARAIEVSKKEKPDLIFMDIMLRDHISGAEAAREIYYANPEIMIVFLTSYSDKEMIEYAVESDAFAYLLKPYRDKEILATLELAKAKLAASDMSVDTMMEEHEQLLELTDGYMYDMHVNRLFFDDKEVPLGPKALKLIQMLCNNRSITLEIDSILKEVWEKPASGQTLRSLVYRIREMTSNELIQNVNKLGYRIGLKE